MRSPSTIQILHTPVGGGEVDITGRVLYAQSRFEVVASAMPGTATVVLKDPDRELGFTTGDEIALVIDGIRMWGGLLLNKGQGHFFPVVDTTDLAAVHDLQWTLTCTDYNIWMDKLVIRDPANYLDAIKVGPGPMGRVLREAIPLYMDVPPGLDYTTYVEDTDYFWAAADVKNPDGTWLTRAGDPAPLRQQGTKWREQLDEVTHVGGYEWRIDANKRLHVTKITLLESPWGFVDRHPNGVTSIGFREGTVREDGSQMVTDALIWGGRARQNESAPLEQEAVFSRYPDPPANYREIREYDPETERDIVIRMTVEQEQKAIQRIIDYGRWQRGEINPGNPMYFDQDAVDLRAYSIVAGPDTGTNIVGGLDMGLNRPVWQVSLSWFAHDVPGMAHLVPGQFVPLVFYTMDGENGPPLALFLPLRHLNITFPTLPPKLPGDEPLTYVRFDGEFGISYSDSRYLWRFLLSRTHTPAQILASTGQSSDRTIAGALAGNFPTQQSDGARTQFTLPHTYLAGTLQVYINGLLQRPRFEYVESSPSQGIFTFVNAPFPDDTIWVVYRTGAG